MSHHPLHWKNDAWRKKKVCKKGILDREIPPNQIAKHQWNFWRQFTISKCNTKTIALTSSNSSKYALIRHFSLLLLLAIWRISSGRVMLSFNSATVTWGEIVNVGGFFHLLKHKDIRIVGMRREFWLVHPKGRKQLIVFGNNCS